MHAPVSFSQCTIHDLLHGSKSQRGGGWIGSLVTPHELEMSTATVYATKMVSIEAQKFCSLFARAGGGTSPSRVRDLVAICYCSIH